MDAGLIITVVLCVASSYVLDGAFGPGGPADARTVC